MLIASSSESKNDEIKGSENFLEAHITQIFLFYLCKTSILRNIDQALMTKLSMRITENSIIFPLTRIMKTVIFKLLSPDKLK